MSIGIFGHLGSQVVANATTDIATQVVTRNNAGSLLAGVVAKSNLLSFALIGGLSLAERWLRSRRDRTLQTRDFNLSIDPQWPSKRVFGRREVGGQVFFAGYSIYRGDKDRTKWTPPTALPGRNQFLPVTSGGGIGTDEEDESTSLLDMAIWISEGTLTGLDGIRIGDQYIALQEQNGFYTPVPDPPSTNSHAYNGGFYIRTHFGDSNTDNEISGRYSSHAQARGRESWDESVLWDSRRKDDGHSWVAITFVDNNRNLWDRFNDFENIAFLVRGQQVSDMSDPTNKNALRYTDNVAAVQHWVECNLVEGQDYDSVSHRHFQDAYNWAAISHDNNFDIFFPDTNNELRQARQGQKNAFYRDMPNRSKNGTLNIQIDADFDVEEFREHCDTIRQGFTYEYADKLCITVGKNLDMTNAVVIDNEDIVSIRPEPQSNISASMNTLRARMEQSQAHGYQPVDIEISDPQSVRRDGVITQNLGTLVGMTDYMEVVARMNSLVYRQRISQTWRVTVLPQRKYFSALPDSPILLNSLMGRLENHPCRIVAREVEHQTGQITFVLRYAPPNEFVSENYLPPIEYPPGRVPQPNVVTDITFIGRPGVKSGTAGLSIVWASPIYYKYATIAWREENKIWSDRKVVENNRSNSQTYSFDGVDFKVGTIYEFEVVNQNSYGQRSIPYRKKWTARSDTTAPPAPSGVVVTGLVQGVHISRTEIDPATVPDYAKTTATITYTPTGGTEKTENKEFVGTDAEWRFADIGKNDVISLSIVVKDVDTAGNESTGITVTTTTESAYELTNLFENLPIGARFTYNDYQQRTPVETPPDTWENGSWYYINNPPPTPSSIGPPPTRALFESFGVAGQGSDAIVLNPDDSGSLSLVDFADANSERRAPRVGREQFPKFANTLVKIGTSDDYYGIAKIRTLRYTVVDGNVYSIWFSAYWVHTHFVTPPTFGAGVGQPTLTFDFQLSRGNRGPVGPRGNPGGRGIQGLPGEDGDEWRFVIQDTATAGTPTITNKTDRTVDPGVPTGWKKFNSGDADLKIDNILKPFRWEAASQKINGRWSDWQIILLSVGGEKVQAFFTFVPRHKFVQWRRWKSYQITNNVESVTDYTDADVPSSVTGTDARAKALDALKWIDGTGPQSKTPPVPGKQFGNSSTITVPQRVIKGVRESTTPVDTITTSSPLFIMDVRYRNSESDAWVVLPTNHWVFGVVTAVQAEQAGLRHFDEWCTHRYYDSETLGAFQDFTTPEFCRELDHEAFVPVGGTNGQVLFHGSTDTYWKKVEMADIEGFTGTGGQWTNLLARVLKAEQDIATLKSAPSPVDPISIGFSMITRTSFRATVSGGGSGNYQLRYKLHTLGTWNNLPSQVSNSFDVTRFVVASRTYDVQALVGSGSWSPTHTVTTLNETVPGPVRNTRIVRVPQFPLTFTVQWDVPTEGQGVTWDTITGYRAQGSYQSDFSVIDRTNNLFSSSRQITFSVTRYPYYVRIEAQNSLGYSIPVDVTVNAPSSGGGGDQ